MSNLNRFALYLRSFAATAVVAIAVAVTASAVDAETAPGVNISNTATATYIDSAANNYNTTSNTVITTVQNAPTLTATNPSNPQNVTDSQKVDVEFDLTNAGNSAGQIQLTQDATVSANGTLVGYYLTTSGPSTFSCGSYAAPIAAPYNSGGGINSAACLANGGASNLAIGQIVKLHVIYTVGAAVANGQTVTISLGNIDLTYPVAGSITAQTFVLTTTPTETDTVVLDARIDLQNDAIVAAGGNLDITIHAANGSATYGAQGSAEIEQMLGTGAPGVFIVMKVPDTDGNGVPLQVISATHLTFANDGTNLAANTGYKWFYADSETPTTAAHWHPFANGSGVATMAGDGGSGTVGGLNVYYVGMYVYATGALACSEGGSVAGIFCPTNNSVPGTITGADSVKFQLVVAKPLCTAPGAGDPHCVTAIANAIHDNNAGPAQVVMPGHTATDIAANYSVDLYQAGDGVYNVTSAITYASGIQYWHCANTYSYYIGPYGTSGASPATCVGCPSGNNFTLGTFYKAADQIINIWDKNGNGKGVFPTVGGANDFNPSTTNITGGALTSNVASTINNTGNTDDTYCVEATAPAGWTVTVNLTNNGTTIASTPATCGGGGHVNGGAVNAYGTVTITSGSSQGILVTYAVPAGVHYWKQYAATLTSTTTGGAAVLTTDHLLYGGLVRITKVSSVTATGCGNGVVQQAQSLVTPYPFYICPGGTIHYVITFESVIQGLTTTTNASYANAEILANGTNNLIITDDSTATNTVGNNWSTYTPGLGAAVTDGVGGTTFQYHIIGTGAGILTAVPPTGAPTFADKIIATIGKNVCPANDTTIANCVSTGNISFSIVVN